MRALCRLALSASAACWGAAAALGDGGVFGTWIEDAWGGVAYNYTCDQTVDPRAINTDVDTHLRGETEHNFVVGNYRLVAHASNDGWLSVRNDEDVPEWLAEAAGAHAPSADTRQYGLGWGYLFDEAANATVLSTYYNGAHAVDSSERVFGLGYSRKMVERGGLRAEQTVVAPFGDDPVLLSVVRITNVGAAPRRGLSWVENAGGALRLMDRLSATAGAAGPSVFADALAFAEARYASAFSDAPAGLGRGGVRQARAWVPLNASEAAALAAVAARIPPGDFSGPPMAHPPAGAAPFALRPPATYLIDISPPAAGGDGGPAAFGTDCAAFYGAGGRAAPDMLHAPLRLPRAAEPVRNSVGCALAARALLGSGGGDLAPGATATVAFLWAYEYADGSGGAMVTPGLVARYAAQVAAGTHVRDTVAAWLAASFRVNGTAAWAARETVWNSYMLLAAASFDGGAGERVLDQGTAYRYVGGFQGAPRDPAQHLLPAILAAPWLARSVLRGLLMLVQRDAAAFYNGSSAISGPAFNLPYMAVNSYELGTVWVRPSDQEMYVLMAAAEYLLATRDFALLDEPLPLYGDRYGGGPNSTVADALLRSANFSALNVSVGAHGLMRSLTSDWSDCLCVQLQPGCDSPASPVWQRFYAHGESVLNAAMATYVLPLFADALAASPRGAQRFAADIARARGFAAGQVAALRTAGWNANRTWLRRAFLSDESGWLGEEQLFGVQHAWALLSGAVAGDEAAAVLRRIDAALRAPSPVGMALLAPPLANISVAPGEAENGGVWPSLNFPQAWAFGAHNLSLAWDEWAKGSLRSNALAYPAYWAGIWSSSDSTNSFEAAPAVRGRNGAWTSTWPTQCTHRHAWPLWALAKLAGVAFDAHGLVLTPGLQPPAGAAVAAEGRVYGASDGWALRTPVVSLAVAAGRLRWEGHWDPSAWDPAANGGAAAAAAAADLAVSAALPVGGAATACVWSARCGGAREELRGRWPATLRLPSPAEARRTDTDAAASASGFLVAVVQSPVFEGCRSLHWELACDAHV